MEKYKKKEIEERTVIFPYYELILDKDKGLI